MASKILGAEEVPFSGETLNRLNEIAIEAAKSQLAGRRILEVEGPYGLGRKAIPESDRIIGEGVEIDNIRAEMLTSPMIPLTAIQSRFTIPIRDVAAFEEEGIEFGATEAVSAAIALARQEDNIILFGAKEAGVEGITTMRGLESYQLSDWGEIGKSVDDIIAAVDVLDKARFPGPYTMALAPVRYNLLFRRFMQGNLSEFDLLKEVVSGGIVKAPALKEGGVLLAKGRQFASIALGQDMMMIFEGPEGAFYRFALVESLAPRIRYPGAIIVLK